MKNIRICLLGICFAAIIVCASSIGSYAFNASCPGNGGKYHSFSNHKYLSTFYEDSGAHSYIAYYDGNGHAVTYSDCHIYIYYATCQPTCSYCGTSMNGTETHSIGSRHSKSHP